MGRSPRLEYAGAYHHVMNRGAGRQPIFHDDRDRRRFLHFLAKTHDRFDLEIHAFCLMGNHFHLLIRTPNANTGEAMHHITSCYASWFNHRRGTDGSLFRGRYLARHVDQDTYLLHVSRYVHLNPVEANLVSVANEYRWSSMASYLGLAPRPPWLYTGPVLSMIGGSSPRVKYKQFVAAGTGDHHFNIDNHCLDLENVPPLVEAIDRAIAAAFYVDLATVRHGKRGLGNIPRMMAATVSRQRTELPLRRLATHYGFSGPSGIQAAIARLQASLAQDQVLARIFAEVAATVSK